MKLMRGLGWLLLVAGALAAAVLLSLSLVTQWQTASSFLIAAATFIPMLWLPCCVAIVGLVLVLHRWWKLLAVPLAVAAFVVWGLPVLPEQEVIVATEQVPPDLTVVSLNVQYGRADVGELRDRLGPFVDLVAIQEYTPDFGGRLDAVGILDEFPHRVGTEREDAGGTMLLSRTPVEIVATADTTFDNFVATTEVAGTTWHVGVIHSTPPHLGAEVWTEDGYAVSALAMEFAAERLVLVGDFNAIDDHHTMQVLTKGPIRNAMDGATGLDTWRPTWPAGGAVPAFARIDHFLFSDRVSGSRPLHFEISGTDHLGLVAQAYLDPEDP
ncbi:hypothetical protein GCM10028820_22320 [Tessaracoccus terricola]